VIFAFRVDASIQIGSGHVMRCLALANHLRMHGHDCWFVCREHKGHFGELIRGCNHNLVLLPLGDSQSSGLELEASNDYAVWLGVTWRQDAEETHRALAEVNPDWLIVDHYAIDSKWEALLADSVRSIAVIDDLSNRTHLCDLLLDQNLGRDAADYKSKVPETCSLLIGPKYALLRPEFAANRENSLKRRSGNKLQRVLISLGGIDEHNVTGMVLDVLIKLRLANELELDVISGTNCPHVESLKAQLSNVPTTAKLSVGVNDMAERMCRADLCIGAAGGSAWERCCLGLPAILIVLAANQLSGAEALEKSRAAMVIREYQNTAKQLPERIRSFTDDKVLRGMSKAASEIADGHGVKYVLQALTGGVVG